MLVSKPVSSLAAVSNAGSNGWYGKGAKLTLTGSEGVKALQYRIGEGDWKTYEGPVTLDAGTYAIDHRAQDDNPPWSDVSSLPVKVDLTDPTVTDKLVDRTVTLTASDEDSGVAGIQYRLDGGDWLAYTAPVRWMGRLTPSTSAPPTWPATRVPPGRARSRRSLIRRPGLHLSSRSRRS